MDARHLRDEAAKMQTTAQSLRTDAMKTRETAKGHEDNGGDASADYRQADSALAQATANEARALEIEREQKRLEADMKQHIGELEKEKHRLRGSSGLFG